MSSRRPAYRPRRRFGFSLIEMVVSLSIVSILLVGMTSAVVLASRALPSNDTPAAATVDSARALHQLRDDLRAATELLNRTATSITLHLPDRDGDGRPEVITYAWAGTPGDPLTRVEDGNATIVILGNVNNLALDYVYEKQDTAFPGPPGSTSSEQLLSSFESSDTANTEDHRLKDDEWLGTIIDPSLPADATAWRITRSLFYGNKQGGSGSTITFELRGSAGDTPNATIHDSVTRDESTMSDWDWYETTFDSPDFSASETAAIVLANYGGGDAGKWNYYAADSAPTQMFTSADEGASWDEATGDEELFHYVYGTYDLPSDDWTYTQQCVTALNLTLTHNDASATTHRLKINLPNAPEAIAALWETDFNADPTALDGNQDGAADWQDAGTFDTANLADGGWSATDTLRSAPDEVALADPARLDVYLRDTSDNAVGGGVRLRFDRDVGRHACVVIEVNATAAGQVVAIQNQTSATLQTTWVKQTVETSTTVRVTLTTDPANDTVGVAINGDIVGSFAYETTDENDSGVLEPYTDASGSGVVFEHLRLTTGGAVTLTPGAY